MKYLLYLILFFCATASLKSQNIDTGKAVFELLTGGKNNPNGKTWKIVDKPYLSGTGPYKIKRVDLSYYDYPDGLTGEEWTKGALNNSYTFTFDSVYKPLNQNVTANWFLANNYLGTNQAQYADVALVDSSHKEAKFSFDYTGNSFTGYNIVIQNNSYIGYFDKRNNYEIISVSEDSLFLRHKYNDFTDSQDYLDPSLDTYARLMVFVSTTVTSINESMNLEQGIDFYPNPSQGIINVSNRYNYVAIYNQLGELQLTSDSHIVNVQELPSGVYQIKLTDNAGNFSWKKLILKY